MNITPQLHADIITLMPEMWPLFDHGVIARAAQKGLWSKTIWPLRNFSKRSDKRLDDRPYGGGPGMVLQADVLFSCWDNICQDSSTKPYLILLDPGGQTIDYSLLCKLRSQPKITLICGRYEGIDQRFIDKEVDLCVTVGRFVVSGGDIPAMLLLDALVRMLPGALGNHASFLEDSYTQNLLDHPVYTRPLNADFGQVPPVLASGHQANIDQWKRGQMLGRTWQHFPQGLINQLLSDDDIKLLQAYIKATQLDSSP